MRAPQPDGDYIRITANDLDDGIVDLDLGVVMRRQGSPAWAPEPIGAETLAAMRAAAEHFRSLGDREIRTAQFWSSETHVVTRIGGATTQLVLLEEGGSLGEPMDSVWRVAVRGL